MQGARGNAKAVSIEYEETIQKETPDQTSDSKLLESPSMLSEGPLTDTEPLLSQINMRNSSVSVCKPPPRPPLPPEPLPTDTQPLPSSQEGKVSEVDKDCGQTSQTSPNPFSESLHFSQLTLPEQGSGEVSSGTNILLGSSSLSLGPPFTYHSSSNSEPQKEMSACNNTFQVKVIQMGNRKESHEGRVEVSKEADCDVDMTHSLLEKIHESDNSSYAIQKISIDSSSSVQSLGVMSEDAKSFENPEVHKDSDSCEEFSKSEYPVLSNDFNSCQDLKSSHEGTSQQTEVTPCETQRLPPSSRWQKAVDKEGRTVYVDLQTGNSSYEPPEIKDGPVWTCSQPLGAKLPKVPMTHEPGFIPRGRAQRNRDSFTLSHGFTELMSWKKTLEMRKRESAGEAGSGGSANSNPGCTSAGPGEMTTTPSGVTQGVQEALESLMEDCETDNDLVKWTEKPEASPEKSEQSSIVAQICQMWEPPDFAMEAEVLSSGPEGTGPRGSSGVRVYNMIHPYRFSQEMLHSCKVLGQLDEKFIACSLTYQNPEGPPGPASQIVVLFDQHAVHERVRLETIIQENCEKLDSGETVLSKTAVIPPLELELPEDEVRLMQAYAHKFNQRGLYFTRASPSKVLFQLIPSCLVPKEANEVRQKRCQTAGAIVESVVRDLCHTMHQTGGVLGLIPRPISHVFNTNACRGIELRAHRPIFG
ncbi:DNA mismatch repair protein Mlh3 [Portunus trituberculatus]|uniref:DNA mismatch repair protein Mlh3 n=1 Tax=Portunus trituberculatus TaxID=210409 RepID=A0A5B7H6C9_PORTR|nr:DNA mismatch repair protein Mlh3 [Portunus trituberculatus]